MRISYPKLVMVLAVVLSAFVIQVSFLSRIGLPGATPDLVLVVVLALAMATGPSYGAAIGFAAGVAVDLAPPASGSLGQTAAVWAIAGFAAGHLVLDSGMPDLASVGAVTGLAGASLIALAITGTLIGTPEVTWSAVPILVVTQMLYAAVLSFAVLPLIGMLYRGTVEEGRLA